jgi:hypothetical protein
MLGSTSLSPLGTTLGNVTASNYGAKDTLGADATSAFVDSKQSTHVSDPSELGKENHCIASLQVDSSPQAPAPETLNEISALKVELNATRRKLAEYEAKPEPISFRYTATTRNQYVMEEPIPFPQEIGMPPWSDYDQTEMTTGLVLPSPTVTPTPISPTKLCPAAMAFQPQNMGSNLGQSIHLPYISHLSSVKG